MPASMTLPRTYLFIVALSLSLLFPIRAAASDEPLKIGVSLPLSGPLAHIGVDIQRGIVLALEELEKEGTKQPITLAFEDDQYVPRLAAGTGRKLLDVDKADAVVSMWDMVDVIAPLAEQRGIPNIAIRYDPEVAKTYRYTVTFEGTYEAYMRSELELLKALGVTSVGIVANDYKGARLGTDSFVRQAPEFGIRIAADERFTDDRADFSSIVTRLLVKKPEAIMIHSGPPGLEIIARRIFEQRPNVRVMGWFDLSDSPELFQNLPFVRLFSAAPWFKEKFRARYGEDFKIRASFGYDIVRVVARIAAQRGQKPSSREIVEGLVGLSGYEGATGMLSARGTKSIETELVWTAVSGREYVLLSKDDLRRFKTPEGGALE